MGNAVNIERIYINDRDILQWGARALRDSIKVGGTKVENDYFQGRNRTHYTLMQTTFGLKPVEFTLVFSDQRLNNAMLKKSEFEAEIYGGCEIHLPDGFYYRAMLTNIGSDKVVGVDGDLVLIEVPYTFSAIQHDELEIVPDGTSFLVKGTMPKMDCRLQVTVGANADSYTLGGAVFGSVQAGDVLVVDGINKRFLKNGAWTTANSWVNFPSVTSGQNAITALDTVQVEYYPCYI